MTMCEDLIATFIKVYGDEIDDETIEQMEAAYEEVCGEPAH